jgi:hypothetical protein
LDRSLVDKVWHRYIPTKVSLFVWRLLRNRLPTRGNLLRRNILHGNNSMCAIGCDVTETASHLFLWCGNSFTLWSLVAAWLGLSLAYSNDLRQHYIQFCSMAGFPRCTHPYFTTIWYACVWVIWKDRNKRIFQNEASHAVNLLEKIKCNSFVWMKAEFISFNYSYYDWWTRPLLCMGVHQ